MTDTIGPFDGVTWSQDAWYRHASKWAPSGVNGTPAASASSGDLALTFSGLTPTIGAGRAWNHGAGFERSAAAAMSAVPENTNLSLSRRDRVVLRRDLAAKTLGPVLIQGTPSSSPTAPAIQQSETGQWDEPLFSFLVPPNSGTSITGVVDERIFVDPDGGSLAAYNLTNLTARSTAITPPAGRRVYEQVTGRHLYWNAAGWVKYAGPREVIVSNGNHGNSGWNAQNATTRVFTESYTSPVAADTGHLHFVAAVAEQAAGSIVGSVVVTVAGVSFAQEFTTQNPSAATPVVIDMPLSLPAGSFSFTVDLQLGAGQACSIDYSALRITI